MFLSSMFVAIVFCLWLTQFAGVDGASLDIALLLACFLWIINYVWQKYISSRIRWEPLEEELMEEDVEMQSLVPGEKDTNDGI